MTKDRAGGVVEWVIFRNRKRVAFHPFRPAKPDTFPIKGKDELVG